MGFEFDFSDLSSRKERPARDTKERLQTGGKHEWGKPEAIQGGIHDAVIRHCEKKNDTDQ